MVKPKTRPCPLCQTPNTLCRRTCVQCMSSMPVTAMAEKRKKMKENNWAASVQANKNRSRSLRRAEFSVFKLDSLGYRPILFVAHQRKNGQLMGDVIHHVPMEDEAVKEIVLKMRELYEDLLRRLPGLQPSEALKSATDTVEHTQSEDLRPLQGEEFIQSLVPLAFRHTSPSPISSSDPLPSTSSQPPSSPSPLPAAPSLPREQRQQDTQGDLLLRIKEEEDCSFPLDQEQPHLFKEEDSRLSLAPAAVKSEDVTDARSLCQHMKSDAEGTCGKPEPDQHSNDTDSDTDDSEDWRDISDTQSGSSPADNPEVDASLKTIGDHAEGEKVLSCLRCGKKCSSRGGMTRHIRTCGGSVSCWVCGKYFKTSRAMNCHLKTHPKIRSEKPFVCTLCGRSFERKHCLKQHLRIHTGEKPHGCVECDKRFRTASQLTLHLRSHTGEKPYSCSQCGTCFTYKSGLNEHMRRHTGEKPFVCSQCGRRFVRQNGLKDHIKTHNRVQTFSCSQCGEGFKWKKLLESHMRTHSTRESDSLGC